MDDHGVAAEEQLELAVVEALDLDSGAARRLPGGKVSQMWRAQRSGRAVAVRRSPWYRTLDEVRYECELLLSLRDDGAPVAAPAGDPADIEGSPWVVFEWAEGHHPARPVDDPAAYGRLLGVLHRHAASRGQHRQRPAWNRVDEFLTAPRAGTERSLGDVLEDFAQQVGAIGTRLRADAEQVHERLARVDIESLPQLTVHGDFGPHQVLVDGDTDRATVLDWDFTHLDLALADLAIATSMARPTPDRATALLAGYLTEAPGDPGDLDLLGDLRRAFHLNNLANQVCALWAQDVDISAGLQTIVSRLDRERWWGPMLSEAGALARSSRHHVVPSRPMDAAATDLEVALELAERASVVALHHFHRGVTAEAKPDTSPVTEADVAVELLLREGLAHLRPDDAVLGEELGTSAGPADGSTISRTWILDPIDGTRSFARGDTDWRVHVALREGDAITVAAVAAPALGVRWYATAGGGAFEQHIGGDGPPRRLQVSTAPLSEARVASYPSSVTERLPEEHRQARHGWGLELIGLIRGEIDAYVVECCEIWDHAPWVLLVVEAGGAFTDHQGGTSPDRQGGVYSTAAVHDELVAMLGIADPG
jgi:fructose-1,6-bisphosphatase/inositol monophosphatase family enzyme/Ser/Thr protein kinase RdoA (MazF antagonist)